MLWEGIVALGGHGGAIIIFFGRTGDIESWGTNEASFDNCN